MRGGIRAVIEKFYPDGIYSNPLAKKELFSAGHQRLLYEMIGELKHLVRRELEHSSDGLYDFSEKVVIKGQIVLRLSFLGPFAHLNAKGAGKRSAPSEFSALTAQIKEILDHYEYLLLSDDEILEEAAWLKPGDTIIKGKIRVWNCLFCEV